MGRGEDASSFPETGEFSIDGSSGEDAPFGAGGRAELAWLTLQI